MGTQGVGHGGLREWGMETVGHGHGEWGMGTPGVEH